MSRVLQHAGSVPSAPPSISTLEDSARDSPLASGSLAGSAAGGSSSAGAAGPTSCAGSEQGDGMAALAVPAKGLLEPDLKLFAGGSWKSADDSAAAFCGGGGCGSAQGGCSVAAGEQFAVGDAWSDFVEEGEEEGDDPYGADAWRRPWRRYEGLAIGWILLTLFTALAVNVGVGVSNSRRAAGVPAATAAAEVLGAAAAIGGPALAPVGAPQLPPPPPRGKRRRTAPPLPPQPPPPPPEFCEVAPANLARFRFSNVTAVFPGTPEHYAANLIDRKGADVGQRFPAYYNGVVARNCIIGIEAVYTCVQTDNPCNYSPEVSLRLCQSACPNSLESCANVQNLPGHPLLTRVCGLFSRSKPTCLNIGFTAGRQRMMRAYYKLNICQAPPGPRPPPRPPAPPLPPEEYYYV